MEFVEMVKLLQANFAVMIQDQTKIFEVDLDKDALWNLYLDSFPVGTNEIYVSRREYDCSSCRHFIRSIGNVVTIKDNRVKTIWDFETPDPSFNVVLLALSNFVKSHAVSDIYVSKIKIIGHAKDYQRKTDGSITEWNHFNLTLPTVLVDTSTNSEGDIKGIFRDIRNVFKRSLDEITEDSILTVLELISQNSLYKGEEWAGLLKEFLRYKKEYAKLMLEEKDNYTWERSIKVGGSLGKIRNHSIGTLLVSISEGMDLDLAVKKYEAIVAPANYKRPKAIFTQKMLENARKAIEDLGYKDSLARRYATLDDVRVNNILFSNKDSAKRIRGVENIFSEMSKSIPADPKKFSKVEEIPIESFVENVLPGAAELQVFLENKHAGNMVSLIAPDIMDSPTMFKWDNGFSWAYSGNMTDSTLKNNVKSAGGNVTGILRFSIQWNDLDTDKNDLDAHCTEPNKNHIYYAAARNLFTTGQLDVDIRNPLNGTPAVENIVWVTKEKMLEGKYEFSVHNFAHRGGRRGFRAEIEFDGQTFNFNYDKELKLNEDVTVATVTFNRLAGFTIQEKLPSMLSSRDIWGLKTSQFNPVSVVMFSPNYWNEQNRIGHKHYFFMINSCINPENPNGFYNEFLRQELEQHKRVFEALGGKMAVKKTTDQLSGLGFSSTKRDEVIMKVKGQTERVIKIKF